MIAFASAITDAALYRQHAEPGIRVAAEADSVVFPQAAPRSSAPVYNIILDQAAAVSDLEALVIVDQEAEILDPDLPSKLRRAFSDRSVAVVGCAGAVGVEGIAWWQGAKVWTWSVYRSRELNGVEFPGLLSDQWDRSGTVHARLSGEADTVDAMLMCFSPWAVRNLRFDETLGPKYGYDFDYCAQARSADRKVLVQHLALAHYRPLGVIPDPEVFREAHMRATEKWEGRLPGTGPDQRDWKTRARRAEGEAAAARLLSATKMYEAQALARQQERELGEATGSLSWRVTAPIRYAGLLARNVRHRGGG